MPTLATQRVARERKMIRFWLRDISEALGDAIRLLMLMGAPSSRDQRHKGRPPLEFDERWPDAIHPWSQRQWIAPSKPEEYAMALRRKLVLEISDRQIGGATGAQYASNVDR